MVWMDKLNLVLLSSLNNVVYFNIVLTHHIQYVVMGIEWRDNIKIEYITPSNKHSNIN